MIWLWIRGVIDPSLIPWAQGPSRCLTGQQTMDSIPTTPRLVGLSALQSQLALPRSVPASTGSSMSASSALIRMGDGGVLSGCFGTISMMHFDSLGQAYALNPHEKGSPEWRGSPQQPSKDSGQVRVWKERPGSVSHAPHADSMWRERGDSCPVLQSKQGQWSQVTA